MFMQQAEDTDDTDPSCKLDEGSKALWSKTEEDRQLS